MADSADGEVFYAAAFAADGELIGVGPWRLSSLASRWLEFCRGILADHGDCFNVALPAPLDRVQIRCTSAAGAALVSFSIDGQLAVSAAYLRGKDPSAEEQVVAMFVESLCRTEIVQQCQATRNPFQAALTIQERPLHMVVAWGNPAVSEEECGLIAELGNHMAAAFLCAANRRGGR